LHCSVTVFQGSRISVKVLYPSIRLFLHIKCTSVAILGPYFTESE